MVSTTAEPSPTTGRLLGPLVAGVVTLVSLGVAELGLRAFAPVPDPYAALKSGTQAPNRYIRSAFAPGTRLVTTAEPGLPGVTGTNRFTINEWGFRGPPLDMPKPDDELRVFIVGGSTTECLYLDDDDALDATTQRALVALGGATATARVYGAGKSGDRIDDHVSMVVHRLVHLEPDVVVVFAGINDLRASILGYDYLHYDRDARQVTPELGGWTLVKLAAYELQLARRVYYLVKGGRSESRRSTLENITLTSSVGAAAEERREAPLLPGPVHPDTAAYRRNLTTLVGTLRAHGITPVLMTQQTTWSNHGDPEVERWQWMTMVPEGAYPADELARAMGLMNDVVRSVAATTGTTLYDLAATLPPTLDHFYDDVHFNVGGARAAGEGLARHVVEALRGPSD